MIIVRHNNKAAAVTIDPAEVACAICGMRLGNDGGRIDAANLAALMAVHVCQEVVL
ncbi:MAG: hypothetical protein ACYCS4_07840 [Acidimicrobiales bacterium]